MQTDNEEKKQHDDYDSPRKDALDEYFKDFLELLFPIVHDEIDWSVAPQSRDKEFQKVTATARFGRQIADKLKEVGTLSGNIQWVMVHIEVQGWWEAEFAERIFRYDARIFDEFGKQVVSLVVLGDTSPDWRPNSFGWSRWDYAMSVKFPAVKLMDLSVEELEASCNRFAPIVLAHLKTMETKNKPQSRREWKFRIVRSLYERGFASQDVRKLFRLIDWFMALPKEFEQEFRQELTQYEEKKTMPYVSSIERMALAEGEIKGKIETLLVTLETRFGEIPSSIAERVRNLADGVRLTELHREAILAGSLDEFAHRLERLGPQ